MRRPSRSFEIPRQAAAVLEGSDPVGRSDEGHRRGERCGPMGRRVDARETPRPDSVGRAHHRRRAWRTAHPICGVTRMSAFAGRRHDWRCRASECGLTPSGIELRSPAAQRFRIASRTPSRAVSSTPSFVKSDCSQKKNPRKMARWFAASSQEKSNEL